MKTRRPTDLRKNPSGNAQEKEAASRRMKLFIALIQQEVGRALLEL